MQVLDTRARELDKLSRDLADVQRELHPLKRRCDHFVANHIAGQWKAHVDDGVKMARQDVAVILATQALPLEDRGRLETLTDSASRMQKRISDLRAEVDAQRSILSCLKVEMEAMR
jgi:hypothetical protein